MAGVNKVILVGNLGKDPEVKSFDGGNKVSSFSIATSEKYKDKQGNQQEATEWHNIQVWGKLADIVEKYVKKGDKLYIEGKLKTRSYEKDSITRYVTEIVCNNLQMLGGKGDNTGQSANVPNQTGQVSATGDDLPF